jgi:transposase
MRPATGKLGAAVSSPTSSPERPATDAGVEQNVRRKRGVAWVEITDRPAKTAVPYGERVAFLRVVKSLRSKSPQISVRDGGVWCAPKNCITLAAELLQIAPRTAERIHSSFQELKSLPEEAAVVRERQFVMESVFGNEVIKQWVREHLMACVAIKQRATFRSITKYLQEVAPKYIADTTSLLMDDADLQKTIDTACSCISYTNVRRWAKRSGMHVTKLGKIKKTFSSETAKVQSCYARFCRDYMTYLLDAEYIMVYADESFVNQYHARAYAVVDLTDAATRLEGAKKGMRWCLATAITHLGEIEVVDPFLHPANNVDSKSGRWTFCPNKSQAKSQGRDYHLSFCEATYIPYFKERLLPACERAFPGKKLCFVFDNATYHVVASYKVGEEVVSRDKSNMNTLARFIEANGRPAVARKPNGAIAISRAELIVQFDQVVAELGCDLQIFCRSHGHTLLLTPPRASHFQPIELFWAACKNDVAAQYTSARNFNCVRTQLLAAFNKWGTQEFCSKIINHCTEKIRAFHEAIQRADESQEIAHIEVSSDSSSVNSDDDDAKNSSSESY